jgi:hypothetical protein
MSTKAVVKMRKYVHREAFQSIVFLVHLPRSFESKMRFFEMSTCARGGIMEQSTFETYQVRNRYKQKRVLK